MKNKKILYVRSAPYKVNLESYNLQEIGFSKELCKKGFDCDIIYYSNEDREDIIYEYEGRRVTILWVKGIKLLRTGIYPKILNKNFIGKYDLIITTEYNQIMSLLLTKYNPNVVLYNGPYYNMFRIPIMEKVYDLLFARKINKGVTKVFTKSTLASNYLSQKGFDNLEVLGVGLDVSKFEHKSDFNKEVESIIRYMRSNNCILYVGSLNDRKNFRFTLKVFEKINNMSPSTKLVIIGEGKKNYVEKSFKMIDKKVINNILHIDKIDNKYLKHIYPEAKVFILPSKLEIFGMVLLEAMYLGAPTITSVNGGSITLIKNEYNGIVMKNFCEDEWAKKIYKLINDDEHREYIKKNATNTIETQFTWTKICDKFLKIIKD